MQEATVADPISRVYTLMVVPRKPAQLLKVSADREGHVESSRVSNTGQRPECRRR
jgi:hypothetical protein